MSWIVKQVFRKKYTVFIHVWK